MTDRAEIPDSAFDGIHAGHFALLCALGCVLTIAGAVIAGDFLALFTTPLEGSLVWIYWPFALGAIGCAFAALLRRHWHTALSALAIVAMTLAPGALLLFECARGNCL